MSSGFSMVVLPGYQRLNKHQRRALLDLCEAGILRSPVRVKKVCQRVIATDRTNFRLVIQPDGSYNPPQRRKDGPATDQAAG